MKPTFTEYVRTAYEALRVGAAQDAETILRVALEAEERREAAPPERGSTDGKRT